MMLEHLDSVDDQFLLRRLLSRNRSVGGATAVEAADGKDLTDGTRGDGAADGNDLADDMPPADSASDDDSDAESSTSGSKDTDAESEPEP